ncbi:hypothetical protein AVEN_8455-1 [Araneus ventricosus]|uniref:Uncharacterized protein n=1 Tax=Araneus ventricosus TaxID=182803 RepID=A0A4Y2EX73_ARAVE|nr:hypothetical protein AVEN_8455-1 [Araneus ventricosus]
MTYIVILNRGQKSRTTPELPTFHITPPSEETFGPSGYDLACNRLHTWLIFNGIGFRALELSATEADTLPLGHRSPGANLMRVSENGF